MESFEQLGLSEAVLKGIEAMGFQQPTPIQAQVIPKLLNNQTDLVGLAQTGTGKTAAFGLPLVQLVDTEQQHTQALILATTRELCVQITKELQQFSQFIPQINITPVYGGADIGQQIRAIKKGVHIIVATPGRLRDLINRKVVNITQVGYLVLDEADEMLNMGFKEELDDILKSTSDEHQTWLFSATMPADVRRIAKEYMSEPMEVSIGRKNATNEDIDHQYIIVRKAWKYDALRRFLDFYHNMFGLIFTRTRMDAKELAEQLIKDGYRADALHGDLNQNQRDRVMNRFRSKRLKILVATDVAARGIDVQDLTHVFHYNLPDDKSFYTHRSGRTARAGKKGISLALVHPRDDFQIQQIEKKLKLKFTLAHIPTGEEICKQRVLHHIQRIRNIEVNEALDTLMPLILEEFEGLEKEDIVKQLASLSFNHFFKNYKDAPDLNPRKRGDKNTHGPSKRLFINIGAMDVENKSGFLRLICDHCRIPGSAIGKIKLQRSFTFFDVEAPIAEIIIQRLEDTTLEGRSIRVNYENDAPKKNGKKKFDKNKSFKKKGFSRKGNRKKGSGKRFKK